MRAGANGRMTRRKGIHVGLHGLLSDGSHMPEGVLERGGWESGEILAALTSAESATAPCFGAYVFRVLTKKRVRPPRRKVAIYSVEGRSAERL